MKVKDLIEQLQNMDQELDVILQKDSEGNGYCHLRGCDNEDFYIADQPYSIEVVDATDHEMYEDDELNPCVILFP